MKKIFSYPKRKIIFPYITVLVIPLLAILLYFQIPDISKTKEDPLIYSFILFFMFSIFLISLTTLLWIINKLKTKIEIDKSGLLYKSLFKNLFIKWNEMTSIKRKYLIERRYPRRGLPPDTLPIQEEIMNLSNATLPQSNLPNDLIIKTKGMNKIKIYHFLERSDDSNYGISDLENEIKSYCNLDIDKIEIEQLYKKDIKEWRKLIIAAIFLIVIGIIMSLIKINLISLSFIFFGIWLFIFFVIEYLSRIRK